MVCDKEVCDKEVCERWCVKAEDAEGAGEEAGGTGLKTRTPHKVVGDNFV